MYVWFPLKNKYASGINFTTITKSTGSTEYIIPLLHFRFWQPFYYKIDDFNLPSDITKKCDHWFGIVEQVGHSKTFKVLSYDTQKVQLRLNPWFYEEPL